MRNFVKITFMALALILSACGSKKTENADSSEETYPTTEEVAGSGLVLNGNSDAGTAGTLRTVYFAYDKSTIADEAKQILDENARYLIENGNVRFTVEGHADERGGREYNLALGQKRAKRVRDYLVAKGVDVSKVKVISYGKEQPLEFGHDESSWSKNRRASFFIDAL